jgi:hypothetical protein
VVRIPTSYGDTVGSCREETELKLPNHVFSLRPQPGLAANPPFADLQSGIGITAT